MCRKVRRREAFEINEFEIVEDLQGFNKGIGDLPSSQVVCHAAAVFNQSPVKTLTWIGAVQKEMNVHFVQLPKIKALNDSDWGM